MSKNELDAEIRALLTSFASNFAAKDEEGDWWGHDTDLGSQENAFRITSNRIKRLKRKQLPAAPKQLNRYRDLGYINRDAVAKVVWGNETPRWWKGSTAEFDLLVAIRKARV